MKILVIGATGGTGREIVRQAMAAGHEVTALVREQRVGGDAVPDVHWRVGDARDVAALRGAVAGQDAVADSLGSAMSGPFRDVTLFSESTKALIEAMQAENVKRLVCITGIGAGDSRGHGGFIYDHLVQPVLLRGVYADKDRQEELIRASGLDWVIVRPAMLADGPALGGTQALTDLTHFHGGSITRADTAAFVVAQLGSDAWLHKAPLIVHAASMPAGKNGLGKLPSPYDVNRIVTTTPNIVLRPANEGFAWNWVDGEIEFLALGHEVGDCYMLEVSTAPTGGGPVPHVHSREDEFFYVIDGGPVTFMAGDVSVELASGGFINLRAGTAHHFKNHGTPARMLCFTSPAGFDRFQIEGTAPFNTQPVETSRAEIARRLRELAPSYGISLAPDPALFHRAPEMHVVQVGASTDAQAVTTLAGPGDTGGRYALVHVCLAPGMQVAGVGHAIAATGICVLSGQVSVAAAEKSATLTAEGSAHAAGGFFLDIVNTGSVSATLLAWHAPGLAVPDLSAMTARR